MKQTRKLLSILLALAMVCALATTAFATNADLTGHTYKAYQIFSGTQASGSEELGNIQWGTGISGETFLAALQAETSFGGVFASCKTAADVADAMKGWVSDSAQANLFAEIAHRYKSGDGIEVVSGNTPLNAGYYLVVDTTTFGDTETNTVYNLSLLQLTNKGTFEIRNKTDVPEVIKKVDDKNDSNTTQDTVDWEDSADYDIGDHVPFQITATLPTNLSDYTTYKLVFHDTQSAGLTTDVDSIVVKVGNVTLTKDTDYTYEQTSNGFKITISDVIKHGATKDTKVTIDYTSTLNSNAVHGAQGNPNKVYMEYSNNPNYGGEESTGKTPEDKVIVFTYKTVVNKVTKNPDYGTVEGAPEFIPLEGAGFTLYKKDATTKEYVAVGDEVTGDEMTTFTWVGLDDGDYRLVETTTPAGYNTIAPIEFTISATHDAAWEAQAQEKVLTALSGGDKFTGDVNAGSVTGDVENNKGSTLPETGGIGTTIFYTLGGVLVMVAVVLLVTKKRMNGAEV